MTRSQTPTIARSVFHDFRFWVTGFPALMLVAYSAFGGCSLGVFLYSFGWAFLTMVSAIVWWKASPTPAHLGDAAKTAFRERCVCGVVFWIAVIVSVAVFRWPIRATFALSRPALDALADRVERGEKVRFPVRCGVLTVKKAKMNRLNMGLSVAKPRLWLNNYGTETTDSFSRVAHTSGQWGLYDVTPMSNDWVQIYED